MLIQERANVSTSSRLPAASLQQGGRQESPTATPPCARAGLTPRPEALLLDLLTPGAPPVSLRDQTVSAASARLARMQIASEDDMHVALRRGRVQRAVGAPRSASPAARGYGLPRDRAAAGPMHTALTLRLETRRAGAAPDERPAAQTLTFVELVSPDVKARIFACLVGPQKRSNPI
jgi:hypothetical protein